MPGDEDQANEYVPEDEGREADELNKAFEIPEECKTPTEVWQLALKNRLIIPGFKELEDAVRELKAAITAAKLYDGPTEVIHDNDVMYRRYDLIGEIGTILDTYVDSQTCLSVSPDTLESKVKTVMERIDAALDRGTEVKEETENTVKATPDMLKEFIRLHFYCFKDCNDTDCLKMD